MAIVLGQKVNKTSYISCYASTTLSDAQKNYTAIDKELLAIVFALNKFYSYIICSQVVIFTDDVSLKDLLSKKESKPGLIRWEFYCRSFT